MESQKGFERVVRRLRLFCRLWNDEEGFIISSELVLVSTILVIGMIVGLVVVRNQVVQELVDVGQAIGAMSQSYAFGGVWKADVALTDGSFYTDMVDFCQADQVPGQEPGGICVRMWPEGAPLAPPGGEWAGAPAGCYGFGGARGCEGASSAWVAAFEGYLTSVVRVQLEGKPSFGVEAADRDPNSQDAVLNYQLAVFVDMDKYDMVQKRLLQALDGAALRKGEWVVSTKPRKESFPVQEGLLPAGSRYQGVMDVRADRVFQAGDWGTDKANLGKEEVILVNTSRNKQNTESKWAWFNVCRPPVSLHTSLKAKVEFIGDNGKLIGEEYLPLSLGHNACPPGLDVFDVYNRRDLDWRTLTTLGAKNRELTAAAAAARSRDPSRLPEDLLVMVSPFLTLPNGGDPPTAYATRVVVPMSKTFTREQFKTLKDIRCSVVASELPRAM